MPTTFAAVDAFIRTLPAVEIATKWGNATWVVNGRSIAWHRPLSKADIARFGDARVPSGELLAIATANLDAKDALLAIAPPGFFTIEHFNSYPALLVELRLAHVKDVRAAIREAHAHAITAPPKKPRKPRPRRSGR